MDKTIIYVFLFFLFSVVIYADLTADNLMTVVNPHTGWGDIIRSLNQSGNNLTADNFFGNLIGTANNSEYLDGIDSTQFLRSDIDDTLEAYVLYPNGTNPLLLNHLVNKEFVELAVAGLELDYFFTNATSDILGYFVLNETQRSAPQSIIESASLSSGTNQSVFNFSTESGLPFIFLSEGIYDAHIHLDKTGGAAQTIVPRWELYKRNSTGEHLIMISETSDKEITDTDQIFNLHSVFNEDIPIVSTDRLVFSLFVDITGGGSSTVRLYMEGTTDSHFTFRTPSSVLQEIFIRRDGTNQLTGNWDAGGFDITADSFIGNVNHSLNDSYNDGSVILIDKNDIEWQMDGETFIVSDQSDANRWFRFTPGGAAEFRVKGMNFIIQNRTGSVNLFEVVQEANKATFGDGFFLESQRVDLEVWGDYLPAKDVNYDLGKSNQRFENLYLSNNLDDGTNSLTVANAKTAYDFSQGGHNNSDVNLNNVTIKYLRVNESPVECPSGTFMTYTNMSTSICVASSDTTALKNNTDANITTLTTYNITSPYANKSYIFFMPDGSIGITLDPVVSDSPSQEEKKSTETKEYTRGTERTCKDGKCNLVLYSGTRFVEQDDTWVDVQDARSLKDIYTIRYLKNDGIHDFEIVDLNYTSITLKVFVKDAKELNKDIPFKVDDAQKTTKKLISLSDKATVTFTSNNIFASNYSFGSKSTTIILQDADTENLNDDDTFKAGNEVKLCTQVGFCFSGIMYDISSIPSSQAIDDAKLYLFFVGWASGKTVTVNEYSNRTWNEEDEISSEDDIGAVLDTNSCCDNNWFNWDVTSWVSSEYGANSPNVTIAITGSSGGTQRPASKENSDSTIRPYLNITYTDVPTVGITTSLTSPADSSTELDGDITFNCTATPVLSNVTNISLYHNSSGSFIEIENNELNGSFETTVATGFEVIGIANNTFLAWNCLSFNNATNSSFASSNRTLTVLFPTHVKNPKLFVQNLSSIIMWYVDSIGDMFLRNNLDVDGNTDIAKNLTVDTNTFFVDSTNNLVGIGTTTPAESLHVFVDLNVT